MKFDPTKPVQTRDGRKARILCADRDDPLFKIVALYTGNGGGEGASYHLADGRCSGHKDWPGDLINIPERRTLRYRVALCQTSGGGHFYLVNAHGEHEARGMEESPLFVSWASDWQEHSFEVEA